MKLNLFVSFIFIIALSFGMGAATGMLVQESLSKQQMLLKDIEEGRAEYRINSKTGETTIHYFDKNN